MGLVISGFLGIWGGDATETFDVSTIHSATSKFVAKLNTNLKKINFNFP